MKLARLLALLPMLILLSCITRAPSVSEQTTKDHYRYWSEHSQSYEVSFQQSCYCLPDNIRPMRITVKQNKIVGAIFEEDHSIVPNEIISDLLTIDAMFQVIINAEAKPAHRVDIKFDQKNHFPRMVDIDFDSRIADDELHWQLSRLVLLD